MGAVTLSKLEGPAHLGWPKLIMLTWLLQPLVLLPTGYLIGTQSGQGSSHAVPCRRRAQMLVRPCPCKAK